MFNKIVHSLGGLTALHRRERVIVAFAATGLLVAIAFYMLFELDPKPDSPMALWTGGLAMLFCPGSLLFIALGLIDVEVRTAAFLQWWAIVALINIMLYGGIGAIVASFLWTGDDSDPAGSV